MVVRKAEPDDVAFIFPTWMESARQLRQGITRLGIFDSFYPDLVTRLIETEDAFVLTSEGKNTIHAWACGRGPNLLHFAYVPHKLRGEGFARAVITDVLGGYPSTIFVTASPLSLSNHARFVHNPYLRPR